MQNKIGLCCTTFNSESYFDELYNSIPFNKVDHVVVVNGGEPYTKQYDKVHWIQHDRVQFASVARNDGLKYLMNQGCDYYFVCEDDMIIKSEKIFDDYIKASNESGIQYFGFRSNAWGSGAIGARTPRFEVQYSENGAVIQLYKNTCNEFTFRTKLSIDEVGLFDERYPYMFDIDMVYRLANKNMIPGFWYFPDISNADDLIMNNPNAVSRMNPNGERNNKLGPDFERFAIDHSLQVNQIPDSSREEIVDNVKFILNRYAIR